jgi:hypothetical protein
MVWEVKLTDLVKVSLAESTPKKRAKWPQRANLHGELDVTEGGHEQVFRTAMAALAVVA